MKTSRTLALGAVVAIGLSYNARAGMITFVGLFDGGSENPATIVATANANGVDDFVFGTPENPGDLFEGARVTASGPGGTVTNSFGTFEVTETSQGVETITFTLQPGSVLAGLSVHGGGGTNNNYYSVSDETSGVNEGPVMTGGGGGLSGLDFLLEASPIPEPGTAVMLLLGCALAGLVRRRFGQR